MSGLFPLHSRLLVEYYPTTFLQNWSSSRLYSAVKQEFSVKSDHKIHLLVFDSAAQLRICLVMFSFTARFRQSGLVAVPVLYVWKLISVWPVIRPTKVEASHLHSRSCPTVGLLFADKGIGLSSTLCIYQRFLLIFLLSQPEVFLNLCVGCSHRWYRVHKRLPCSQPFEVVSYSMATDSIMFGNLEELKSTFCDKTVEYVAIFFYQIWLYDHVLRSCESCHFVELYIHSPTDTFCITRWEDESIPISSAYIIVA